MYCPKCGVEQPDDTQFCGNCGVKIDLVESVKKDKTITEKKEIKPARGDLQQYTDTNGRFSVSFPKNWVKMQGDMVGFQESEEKEGFIPSFILTYEESPQKDVGSYFSDTKKELQKLKKFKGVSEESLVVDGIPAMKMVYTLTEKKMEITQVVVCLVEGKIGWSLCCSCATDSFNSYQRIFNTIVENFHLLEEGRGEKAAASIFKTAIKKDIRGWGVGLIIIGVISIFIPFLDAIWGGLLIAAGVIELIFPLRAMYIVNGILLVVVGIMNITSAVSEGGGGWVVFGILQIVWGINELRKYGKYRIK